MAALFFCSIPRDNPVSLTPTRVSYYEKMYIILPGANLIFSEKTNSDAERLSIRAVNDPAVPASLDRLRFRGWEIPYPVVIPVMMPIFSCTNKTRRHFIPLDANVWGLAGP